MLALATVLRQARFRQVAKISRSRRPCPPRGWIHGRPRAPLLLLKFPSPRRPVSQGAARTGVATLCTLLAAGSRRGRAEHGRGAIGEAGIGSFGGRVPASTRSLAVSRSTFHNERGRAVSSSSGQGDDGAALCCSDWHAWAAGETSLQLQPAKEKPELQTPRRKAGWFFFLF